MALPERRSEAWYAEHLADCGVPAHMHGAYLRYLLAGIPPGHFLTAVLANDLHEACERADADNQRALFQHVLFLHNYAPEAAWGSPERVRAWVQAHQPQPVTESE